MIQLPNLLAKLVDDRGLIQRPWNSFFQQFVQQPPPFITLEPIADPFVYDSREPGTIAIVGGTITNVDLTRGAETLSLGAVRLIPVAIRDIITLTYSVVPTAIRFIPSYGQNTTQV